MFFLSIPFIWDAVCVSMCFASSSALCVFIWVLCFLDAFVFYFCVNSSVSNNVFQMGSVLYPCVCDFIELATLSSGCVCFCFSNGLLDFWMRLCFYLFC